MSSAAAPRGQSQLVALGLHLSPMTTATGGASSSTTPSTTPRPKLEIHWAVWDDDLPRLDILLASATRSALLEVDPQFSSPLFLAIRLRHIAAARKLVAAGAPCDERNEGGSQVLLEASKLTRSDETDALLEEMMRSRRRSIYEKWMERWPALQEALATIPDFEVTLKWEFNSWIPLVGRLLPSDNLVVRKRGGLFRTDYTIAGFEGRSWSKGEFSQLLQPSGDVVGLDHREKGWGSCAARFPPLSAPPLPPSHARLPPRRAHPPLLPPPTHTSVGPSLAGCCAVS